MTAPVVQVANHIASAVWTFAALIVGSALVAFAAAHFYGGASRRKRRAIFSTVGFVGMVFAALYTTWRLRLGRG